MMQQNAFTEERGGALLKSADTHTLPSPLLHFLSESENSEHWITFYFGVISLFVEEGCNMRQNHISHVWCL